MLLLRLLVLVAICLVVPCMMAQTSQVESATANSAGTVFSAGTNAYTITVATSETGPARVGVGRPASLLVTVTPVDRYNQPVKLVCDKLPPETSCTFDLDIIPAGGGTTTMLFNTTAPHDCGSTTPYFYGNSASLRWLGPMLAGLLLLWPLRRRIWMRSLLGLLILSGVSGLIGCAGHCTDLGTRPGTYTFVLNGTGENTVALALGDLVTVPITISVND